MKHISILQTGWRPPTILMRLIAGVVAGWKGKVELRGLRPGKYRVSDYSEAKELGTVDAAANGMAKLAAEFKDHLLLEVGSQP